MKAHIVSVLLLAIVCAACSQREAALQRDTLESQPTAADIVYMTPTAVPTLVPTAVRFRPTTTPADNDNSRSVAHAGATCETALGTFFETASDHCLTGPTGFFCNGGLPPTIEPDSDALSASGALAEAARIDNLHSPPFSDDLSGGLVWLRLEENILIDALLIGDVQISNLVSADSVTTKWQSFTVKSGTSNPGCEAVPETGALVVQGLYGQSARLGINGVSAEINGTLIVLTQGDTTKFIVIEGNVLLVSYGHSVTLNVGQQLNLGYAADDWTRPAQLPGSPVLLEYDLIKRLPVVLFDRPVPIPLPGYARTQGGVNMREEPDINSRLLYQVPADETMSILGISMNREWLHIRLGNGETGWMSAELLARNLGQITQFYDLTPEPPQRYGVYASRALVNVAAGGNLREAPDTAFRVKRTLPNGMDLNLLARSPYSPWVKVNADGEVGWMALFTLETESVISSLPIDYDVPLPPRATATPSFSYGGGHAYPNPEGGF